MNKFWVISDSSFLNGPLSNLVEARSEAERVNREFDEPALVLKGSMLRNTVIETVGEKLFSVVKEP